MKSLEHFLDEATAADLKAMGASDEKIAMLKKRQAARGKGFETGDDRAGKTKSSFSSPKALPAAKGSRSAGRGGLVRRAAGAVAKQGAKSASRAAGSLAKRGASAAAASAKSAAKNALARRPADKGAALVRQKSDTTRVKKEVPKGVAKTKGPAVKREDPNTNKGTKTYDRINPERKKGGAIVPYKAQKKKLSPYEKQMQKELAKRDAAKRDKPGRIKSALGGAANELRKRQGGSLGASTAGALNLKGRVIDRAKRS